MARKTFTLNSQNNDFNIERFRTRLTAKFCVVFVALTQILTRLISMIVYNPTAIRARLPYFVSLPFYGLTAFIVCLEYFLFKRIGPKILKYAQIIDICLLVAFTAEFLTILSLALSGISHQGVTIERLDSLFAFTSFGWRTLFVMFLIQNWKLTIIPPAVATLMVTGFIVYYKPGGTAFVVVTGILQSTYLVMMLYFHDKIKWREVFTNVQQERWMQVNNFVLNNIPENIFILELGGGKVKFVSDYCKEFMKKLHVEERFLFQNIRELKRQLVEDESESPLNGLTTENPLINLENFDNLEELIENFQGIIQDANLQEKQFLIYNGKLRIENHHTKSIEIKISFIQQHNKEYIVLIIRDTTQRDLLVTLEANNKYKDQLLASVSHELRAPLNGNINLVESAIGQKGIPGEIKEKLLVPALRSSKFLLHLINDILDMSQIKAQKLRLIFKPGKLLETLQDTMKLVELGAKRKGVELSLVIDPDIQQKILWTDHIRLSQIVLNLLNNAIKFTQKGSIVLSATSAEDPNCTKISVQDSGIGMTKEDIKKLFSDYTHIEFTDRAEINPTGVGLGLSITYNLAKLLGPEGQEEVITVDSVVNEGSTFSFIVENKEEEEELKSPAASFERISDEIDPSENEKKRFSKLSESLTHQRLLTIGSERSKKNCECPKILVVDDNPFNTMAFETVLGSLNSKCDCVFDGRTAIDKILERKNTGCGENCRPYQVVFMDQEMPGMTGSETTRELRQLQRENKVAGMKIVGCTAHGSAKEVERFMEAGIDLCIHKPITTGELQKILGEFEV